MRDLLRECKVGVRVLLDLPQPEAVLHLFPFHLISFTKSDARVGVGGVPGFGDEVEVAAHEDPPL